MSNLNIHLDRQLILQIYKTYANELAEFSRFELVRDAIGKMYHDEERRILYLLTRHIAPQIIVEFSPNKGWSTLHLAQALEANGQGHIYSFELDSDNVLVAQKMLSEYGLEHRVTFHAGDVRKTLPTVLSKLGPKVDFLFVDSNHSYDFARWWLSDVLPFVKPQGLVHVHDVEYSHQFGWKALTHTHLGKGIYGLPERRFIRSKSWQRTIWKGHLGKLLPDLVRTALVPKKIQEVLNTPHYIPGNSVADLNAMSGPGEAIAVKEYLDMRPGISWLSVMALIEDPEYRKSVAPYGGGKLVPWPDPWGYQRSPSLYFIKGE